MVPPAPMATGRVHTAERADPRIGAVTLTMAGRVLRALRVWIGERPMALPLLAVVAVLIGSGAGATPSEGSWTGLPPFGAVRWLVTVAVGLLALIGVIVLAVARRPEAGPRQTRAPVWPTLLVSAVLIGLLGLLDPVEREPVEDLVEEPVPGPEWVESRPDLTPPGPGFESGDGTALLAILVGAVATIWWLRRSTGADDLDDDSTDAEPSPSFDSAVARASRHLLDRSDPRAAVLLAYRDLETTLGGLGLERRSTETPTEHLDRALAALDITDPGPARPLLDLAGLYGRARFSHHPITEDERHRAGLDLERAHRRLAGRGPIG